MKVSELAKHLDMKVLTSGNGEDNEVEGVYICDLLSWVMAKANKGNAWITVLTHINIVAVALLTEVSCIIVPEDIVVEEASITKASLEGIVILSSSKSAYELACEAGKILC